MSKPYWQHEPCPPWCDIPHGKFDAGSDRDHFSEWSSRVVLTLMEPRRCQFAPGERVYHTKPSVQTYLRQPDREIGPRIQVVSETAEAGIVYCELTADEALKLIKALTTAVDIAEGHANPGGAR